MQKPLKGELITCPPSLVDFAQLLNHGLPGQSGSPGRLAEYEEAADTGNFQRLQEMKGVLQAPDDETRERATRALIRVAGKGRFDLTIIERELQSLLGDPAEARPFV